MGAVGTQWVQATHPVGGVGEVETYSTCRRRGEGEGVHRATLSLCHAQYLVACPEEGNDRTMTFADCKNFARDLSLANAVSTPHHPRGEERNREYWETMSSVGVTRG